MARCWSAVSATLLMAGCYTGVDGLDRGDDPDALPPGAADDAGEDAGDDDGEPDEPDVPCRTAGRTATRLLTAVEYENSVRRLLGVDTEVRSSLPIDETVSDLFVHNATAELDEGKARKYMLIAEQLVDVVTADFDERRVAVRDAALRVGGGHQRQRARGAGVDRGGRGGRGGAGVPGGGEARGDRLGGGGVRAHEA